METIDSIKVKMFRHGFGDCFLLRFYHKTTVKYKILIDCGLKLNDKVEGVSMRDVVEQIRKDTEIVIKNKKKPHLDALVITHEHWDHVSGFKPEDKLFDGFQIDNIWLAWTENPNDGIAKQINKRLTQGALALNFATKELEKENTSANNSSIFMGEKLGLAKQKYLTVLNDLVGLNGNFSVTKETESGIKINETPKLSLDTQIALDNIKNNLGKNSVKKYLNPGQLLDNIEQLTGVRIYVLGPPKNAKLNKDSPSSGKKKEVYMSLANAQMDGFIKGVLNKYDKSQVPFFDNGDPFPNKEFDSNDKIITSMSARYEKDDWRTIKNDWLDTAGILALQMDQDTNNTSLVLAFELIQSGKILLFPGDAQVGNWLSWHDYTWKVTDKNLNIKTVTATDLLNQTVFYKAGHHASHNATLKELGLELMTNEDLVVFVPEKEKQYNGIPYLSLVNVLEEKAKGRVLFSADKNFSPEQKLKNKVGNISEKDWEHFKENIKIDDKFIEYTIKNN